MKLVDASSASSLTGNWFAVRAGMYTPIVSIASAGTVTLQYAVSATAGTTTGTSLGNLKDPNGTDYSFTATAAPRYGQFLPSGYVRASTSGVSGGAVSVWLSPIDVTNYPFES